MKLFAEHNKPLTATIEADLDNDLWPEFKIQFLPAVGFEIAGAEAGGPTSKMDFLKEKVVAWSGLKADKETAAYLNANHAKALKRTINEGEDIPYLPELFDTVHSICMGIIWQKVAGYVKLDNRLTARHAADKLTKN